MPFIFCVVNPKEKRRFYTSLYKTYYPVMSHQAYKIIRDYAKVEDIVQDALVRLLKQYGKLKDMEERSLTAYLILTVKSAAINEYNKRHRDSNFYGNARELDHVEEAETPMKELLKKEETTMRIQAIQSLPAAMRDLLLFKYLLEKSNAELAILFGTSEGNIRLRLMRARRKLCGILEGLE